MHLSRIALYSFASLDLVVSSSYPLFLFTRTISSYYPTRLLSRSVCISALYVTPSTPLLLYFSNLPEIVFLLVRDRLCHRPSFPLVAYHWPRTVYLPCRPLECSSTLISSGLFCFPYLLVLPESHFICKYILHLPFFLPPPSPLSLSLCLLSRFLKFLLFNLHFSEWLSFSIVRSHRDALHFAHLFQFSLDLLILSINQISPPPLFFIRTWRRRFCLFTHRPMFHLASATSRLYIYSPFIHFARVALPYQSFFLILSLSSTTLPVCPQQICTLF